MPLSENDMEKTRIMIYDSTLRDGAQGPGISFTVEDKLKIVSRLDRFGIAYIEAGNPGSNPKDMEFYRRAQKLTYRHAKLVAFGSTRRVYVKVEDDPQIKSLLETDTPAVAIFGKSWDFQVKYVLRTDEEENLRMISDTISYFKKHGKEVIFDAEHFFDGYKSNPDYAMKTLRVAWEAGADSLCLCDTNGGGLPSEIGKVVRRVVDAFPVVIGIHCHNDTGMAVANSIMAVEAGATQVQGTINGMGERCGNANLCTLIPNLQLKMKYSCIPSENLKKITSVSRYVSEIANVVPDDMAPYVGRHAFSHKAGMHIDAIQKNSYSYEHVDPAAVGNERRYLMSDAAGRAAVISKIKEVDESLTKDSPETALILKKVKELEYEGNQFEGAEGSFELLIRRVLGKHRSFFLLKDFKVVVTAPTEEKVNSTAMIKVNVDGVDEITAAEGEGPVNALDKALRKALERFYPQLREMYLNDYKVRVLDSKSGTAAKVRVLIESTDGKSTWSTIGVSTDIIDASWKALVDSIEYKLQKDLDKQNHDEDDK